MGRKGLFFAKLEEPLAEAGFFVCAAPDAMSIFAILGVGGIGVEGLDGIEGGASADGRDGIIDGAMEDAYGDGIGGGVGGEGVVACTAADDDSGGDIFGPACEVVPGAISAHADAGDIDASGVNGEFGLEFCDELVDILEAGGGVGGHGCGGGVAPWDEDPLGVVSALREDVEGLARGALEEGALGVFGVGEVEDLSVDELGGIVIAAFAGAV